MAYGDVLGYGKLKKAIISYEKPNNSLFISDWVKVYLENTNDWCYTLQFENRKEWFKFVKTINKLNKDFKKIKNIELEKGSDIK